MLTLNVFQIFTILLRPFSPSITRVINERAAGFWYWCLVRVMGFLGIVVRRTGVASVDSKGAFLIANHQSMADIPVLLTFVHSSQALSLLKWFVKDPLKWIPGLGWGMLMLDCLFVKRNWLADKDRILACFSRLRESSAGFWVVSFVEGTRFTPEKHRRSEEFAKKTGLKPLQNLLQPRPKGFLATLEGLEGRIDSIIVATIQYPSPKPPGLCSFLLLPQKKPIQLHLEVHKVPPVSVREAWLYETFQRMDQRLRLGQ